MTDETKSWLAKNAVPIGVAAVLAVVAIVFHAQIIDWFAGADDGGKPAATGGGHDHGAMGQPPEGGDDQAAAVTHSYAPEARDALQTALAAYDRIREQLANDTTDGVAMMAHSMAAALEQTKKADPGLPAALAAHVDAAAHAAHGFGDAADLSAARASFATVSEHVVPLAIADPEVRGNLHVFECTMTDGFNKWMQTTTDISNPYQGQKMLTCGAEVAWESVAPGAGPADTHEHDPSEIDHYTCPMDTWVNAAEPGPCPVCGMDLVPVTKEEMRTGVMRIDHRRRQLIGLRTALVERRPLTVEIRAVGDVTYDETRLADVTLKYDGWIEKLNVEESGQRVRRGQTLFTIYSPDLYSAQQEYLLAVKQRDAASDERAKARAEALVRGAKRRLALWDIGQAQLDRIAANGEAMQYLPIKSPVSGYVVEKDVVEGASVKAGQRLFRIADLERVWVEAEVYEQDIPLVKKGAPAKVVLSHVREKQYEGTVSFVYPYLDGQNRTQRVRVELPNAELELKPDMYANVLLSVPLGERLAVPEAAIIYSGPRRIVFLDVDRERLKPQVIEVGAKAGGYYEVLSGLEEGDRVVTSGNFLLSAESRLKAATGLW